MFKVSSNNILHIGASSHYSPLNLSPIKGDRSKLFLPYKGNLDEKWSSGKLWFEHTPDESNHFYFSGNPWGMFVSFTAGPILTGRLDNLDGIKSEEDVDRIAMAALNAMTLRGIPADDYVNLYEGCVCSHELNIEAVMGSVEQMQGLLMCVALLDFGKGFTVNVEPSRLNPALIESVTIRNTCVKFIWYDKNAQLKSVHGFSPDEEHKIRFEVKISRHQTLKRLLKKYAPSISCVTMEDLGDTEMMLSMFEYLLKRVEQRISFDLQAEMKKKRYRNEVMIAIDSLSYDFKALEAVREIINTLESNNTVGRTQIGRYRRLLREKWLRLEVEHYSSQGLEHPLLHMILEIKDQIARQRSESQRVRTEFVREQPRLKQGVFNVPVSIVTIWPGITKLEGVGEKTNHYSIPFIKNAGVPHYKTVRPGWVNFSMLIVGIVGNLT